MHAAQLGPMFACEAAEAVAVPAIVSRVGPRYYHAIVAVDRELSRVVLSMARALRAEFGEGGHPPVIMTTCKEKGELPPERGRLPVGATLLLDLSRSLGDLPGAIEEAIAGARWEGGYRATRLPGGLPMDSAPLSAHVKLDDLLKVLVHDLANPLHEISLQAAVGTIEDASGPAGKGGARVADWAVVADASERLSIMLNSARVVLRGAELMASSERRGEAPRRADLVRSARTAAAAALSRYPGKGVSIDVRDGRAGVDLGPLIVRADPEMLTHFVLVNLMTNAVKFSRSGHVVTVEVGALDEFGVAFVSITDRGAGMDAKTLRAVYGRGRRDVRRASMDGTGGERGQGYGTAIACSFASAMGARVTAESSTGGEGGDGSGTVVTVVLRSESASAAVDETDSGAA